MEPENGETEYRDRKVKDRKNNTINFEHGE